MSNWTPFTTLRMPCDCGINDFFLVRQIGNHPSSGKQFIPIVAQLVDGELYSSDSDLGPIVFGLDGPECNPFKANLEWMPIPE